MLILKSLELKNFLSHSDTKISFRPNQKLLIAGNSGGGKSSLQEAIVWSLYGQGRGDNRSLIKNGKSGARVILNIQDDTSPIHYKIERSITKTNKHTVDVSESVDGKSFAPIKATGIKGVQEYLEKNILKSSYLLFINSIVYLQENSETFVKQTAAKRKEIILEIINSNNYDDYLKRSKEAIQENKLSIGIAESKIQEKEIQISRDKDRSANISIYKEQKKKIADELLLIEKDVETVQAEYDSYSEKLAYLKGKEGIVIDIINKIDSNNRKIDEINKRIISIQTADIKKLESDVARKKELEELLKIENGKREDSYLWQAKLNEVNRLLPPEHDYSADIATVNKKIILAMGEQIPECPNCGTKYPSFEDSKQKKIKDLEDDLSNLKNNEAEYNKKKNEYSLALETIGKPVLYDMAIISSLNSEIEKYRESEKKLNELAGMTVVIEQLSQDITSINTEQSDLIKKKETVSEEISGKSFLEEKQKDSNSKRIALNGRKQTLTSQNIENESLLAIAEDASRNIERNKADIEKLKQDLSSAKKDGESLKLIKEAFSPNGIKAIVIDYVIPQLEEKINEILSKLSDFRVILETQKTGAKEETILEGLFITVVNELGEHLDFQSFSGGEKIKISLSINEALAEISKINFRFFDETVVALDNESVQQFLEAMNNIQEKVSQVLCISHMQEIKDSFDEKITVIKNNGNSIIK